MFQRNVILSGSYLSRVTESLDLSLNVSPGIWWRWLCDLLLSSLMVPSTITVLHETNCKEDQRRPAI